jgi:hypothetical protein
MAGGTPMLKSGFEGWLSKPGSPQLDALQQAQLRTKAQGVPSPIGDPMARMMYEMLADDPRGATGQDMQDYRSGMEQPDAGDQSAVGKSLFAQNSPYMAEIARLRDQWESVPADDDDDASRVLAYQRDVAGSQRADDDALASQLAAEAKAKAKAISDEDLMRVPGYYSKSRGAN